MIPVKLTMRNFMCYRDGVPPLSFDGLHLACLSGENGSGKSALIDAMTWALWGKTRTAGTKISDDELIAAGKAEMEVDFEFAVGEQHYRIIRQRSRPKKAGGAGQSLLEFQVADGGGFRAISGDIKTQTQQKIIDVLHMDYDTFVNSAYLRQGHADEFTVKDPTKRKEVLADILGLALYDELEERAREAARQRETERLQVESAIGGLSEELARRPAYEAELEQAQNELARTAALVQEKETALNGRRQQKEALQNKKTQRDELEARLGQNAADLERWQTQAGQHRARLQEYEAVTGRRPAIEDGFTRFTQARQTNEDLDKKLRQSASLEKTRSQLEKRIQDGLNELKTSHAVTRNRMDELEARAQKLPGLKERLVQAQGQLRQLEEQEAARQPQEEAAQKLQAAVNHLEAAIIQMEKEIAETAGKLDLLATQTGGTCPLCGTALTADGLEHIAAEYTRARQKKSDLIASSRAELAQKQNELKARQQAASLASRKMNAEKTQAQSQAEITKNEMAAAEESAGQLAELKKALEDIERHLAQRDFAIEDQRKLEAVEAELAALGYDAEKHEQVRRKVQQLGSFEADQRRLEEAERLMPQEREAAQNAEKAAQELRDRLAAGRQQQAALAAELTQLPQVQQALAAAEAEHRALAAQQSRVQEALGQVKEKLKRCDEMATRRKEQESQLDRAAREGNIYQELAEAFGKKGIQAMLIETAFPEVEAEANRLLERMTDNRMHVKFETQRETRSKKGSVIETLDINIADEMGTRNYEMFSGGEAFRINFAIRIALSKLLARRAGAPLRTLIIDEGFGTQDTSGLEKLKEAINSIQDDFDKILVITHVEELRDAFPARIDVTKTAEGSTVSVS